METKDIRRLNVDGLAKQLDSLEAVGAAINKVKGDSKNYANYLSQVRIGSRGMGARMARNVEEAMGLPKGWMDTLQFKTPEDAMHSLEAAQISAGLEGPELEAWLQHGRLLLERRGKKGDNNPFGGPKKPTKGTQ